MLYNLAYTTKEISFTSKLIELTCTYVCVFGQNWNLCSNEEEKYIFTRFMCAGRSNIVACDGY